MGRLIEMAGLKFGRLTVLHREKDTVYLNASGYKCVRWVCRCECGTVLPVLGYSLRSGNTRSCGGLKRKTANNKN